MIDLELSKAVSEFVSKVSEFEFKLGYEICKRANIRWGDYLRGCRKTRIDVSGSFDCTLGGKLMYSYIVKFAQREEAFYAEFHYESPWLTDEEIHSIR